MVEDTLTDWNKRFEDSQPKETYAEQRHREMLECLDVQPGLAQFSEIESNLLSIKQFSEKGLRFDRQFDAGTNTITLVAFFASDSKNALAHWSPTESLYWIRPVGTRPIQYVHVPLDSTNAATEYLMGKLGENLAGL
ncbi:hypothetical protein MUO32_22305 [Shinella sp. CPCC 101442]|uniref:hypothetical protein n=1 Tax=Shinella sp. CPCC 101442 TaxID=2932265 RepID=UPI0021525561|nr:hypothetical protein [Shinella sp. CPCC 101442]MCR6501775.1 hypothetical protein [Shinella sp. CPCC 101442]